MRETHPPPDAAARQRAAQDLDTTFLMEAAAGTGKTTVLIERVLNILRQGRAALAEVVAITFTDKAALELKDRLREAIEREWRDADADGRGRYRLALEDLEAMPVGTIHRFCADLLREQPVEAEVEPGFSIVDELAASVIQEEAWARWFARELSRDNRVLHRAIASGVHFGAGREGGRLPPFVRFLIENRDVAAPPRPEPGWPDARFAEAARDLRDTVAALVAHTRETCRRPDEDNAAQQTRVLAEWVESLDGEDFDSCAEWLARAPATRANVGQGRYWASPEALAVARTRFQALAAIRDEATRQAQHRVISALFAWAAPFLDEYARAKRDHGALDFMDLLLGARGMLRDRPGARRRFKEAFKFILVDEFQDTDPLQAEIVFFLAEELNSHAERWEDVWLCPGKLFLAGDPKQSIYRFRRADLDLYGRAREKVAQQGEVLRLTVNFRTAPEIIAEVNSLFAPLMTGPTRGRFEPEHVPLAPHRESIGPGRVRLLCPPPSLATDSFRAEDWRRAESAAIAETIHRMIAEGPLLPDGAGGSRPAAWRDVAILYRATTGLATLEDALRARDIPYHVAGGSSFYERREFQDLLATLRAIDNPFDALSVVTALRSPFFGQSDEDLMAHVGAGGTFDYRRPLPPGSDRLTRAFRTLDGLHRLRREATVPRLIEALFERTQALHLYALKANGPRRVANLLKAQDMARALEEAQTAGLSGLVRWLGAMKSAGADEEEGAVAEEGDDVVQLMTFHKAKGLEFPIVALAHLAGKDPHGEGVVLRRSDATLRARLGRVETLGWASARSDEADRNEYERRRLLYVAATRARDLLMLPLGWRAEPTEGLARFPAAHYLLSPDGTAPSPNVERIVVENVDFTASAGDALRVPLAPCRPLPDIALEWKKHREEWRRKVGAAAQRLNEGQSVLSLQDDLPAAEEEIAAPAGEETQRDARMGRLVRHLIEQHGPHEASDLLPMAQSLARRWRLGIDAAHEAARLAGKALESPSLAAHAAKGKAAHFGVPFAAMLDGTLVEGRITALLLDEDSAVIMDFRIERMQPEQTAASAAHLLPRCVLMARALRTAMGIPVREAVLVFLRAGKNEEATEYMLGLEDAR